MENLVKLGLNPAWLIAQIVNFVLLLLILRAVAYKPILNMLDARKKKIQESLEYADKVKRDAEDQQKEFDRKLAQARQETQAAAAAAAQVGEKERERIVAEAREEQVFRYPPRQPPSSAPSAASAATAAGRPSTGCGSCAAPSTAWSAASACVAAGATRRSCGRAKRSTSGGWSWCSQTVCCGCAHVPNVNPCWMLQMPPQQSAGFAQMSPA